jgi:hypothetical protein
MSLSDARASTSPAVVETRPNLARRLRRERFTKTAYSNTFLASEEMDKVEAPSDFAPA